MHQPTHGGSTSHTAQTQVSATGAVGSSGHGKHKSMGSGTAIAAGAAFQQLLTKQGIKLHPRCPVLCHRAASEFSQLKDALK
jgi:hypothetical protein